MKTSLFFLLMVLMVSCKPKIVTNPDILRADAAIDELLAKDAKLEILDSTLNFTEGPVWNKEGFLLFSDIPENKIVKWEEGKHLSTYLTPSNNSNGLTYDKNGLLVICSHSARGVYRQEKDGSLTELAHKYNGKQLNSPNDLVISSKEIIYFTDPSWGLKGNENSPDRELSFNGVYMISSGVLKVIDSTLWRPNGIALSPDQKTLYVTDMFENNTNEISVLYRYELAENGEISSKSLIKVMDPKDEILSKVGGFDGIKTDVQGNIYCTGPHGIVILSSAGKYIGYILTPQMPTNCGWGGADYMTLYITARPHLYRIKMNVKGFSPLE